MRWGKKEDIDLAWWGLFVVLIMMIVAVIFKIIEFRTGMIILEALK